MRLARITSNPKRMNGQPCIRNLRLTVRPVIELLATYPDREELHQEFSELEDEDIRQALIFASSYLDDRIIGLPNRYETVAWSGIATLCGSVVTWCRYRHYPCWWNWDVWSSRSTRKAFYDRILTPQFETQSKSTHKTNLRKWDSNARSYSSQITAIS